MTVSTTSNSVTLQGNDATTVFPFTFPGVGASYIDVYYTDADGVETLIAPANYTLALNEPSGTNPTAIGGTVTYNPGGTPIAAGTSLTIVRDLPETQPTSLANQSTLYQKTIEAALDWIVMNLQQVSHGIDQSIKVAVSDDPPTRLPTAAQRALKALVFDADGNPTAGVAPASGTISAAMQPVVSAATLALGRAAFGLPITTYATRAAVEAVTVDVATDYIQVFGYTAIGDSPPMVFQRIATPVPVEPWHVEDASGAFFELIAEKVCPEMFGAVRDGVVDDFDAIEAARDAATAIASKKTLYFLAGTYHTTQQILISDTINIEGAGPEESIIYQSVQANATATFKVLADNVHFRDLWIKGPWLSGGISPSGERNGIWYFGTSGSQGSGGSIKNCQISNYAFEGILIEYFNDFAIQNSRVHTCALSGISTYSSDRTLVDGNTVHNINSDDFATVNAWGIIFTFRQNTEEMPDGFICTNNTVYDIPKWEALDTHGGSNGIFANNVIWNVSIGINVGHGTAAGTGPKRIVVANNSVRKGTGDYTVTSGLRITGFGPGSPAIDCTVVGNTFTDFGVSTAVGFADANLLMTATTGCTVSGNTFKNSYGAAIYLLEDNLKCNISGNIIDGIQTGLSGAAGFFIEDNSQSGLIANNYIDATAEYCFNFDDSAFNIHFNGNVQISSGTKVLNLVNAGPGFEAFQTSSTNLGSIASGAQFKFDVTFTGVELQDKVEVTLSVDTEGLQVNAFVKALNTVTILLQNLSGAPIDLGPSAFDLWLKKK